MRSSALVGSMTFISRILGLARDVVMARYLGADGAADAFYVAFRIPNMFRRFFAEGAFSQAFVPVLSEYRAGGNAQAVRYLIDRVAGCLGLSLLLLCSVVVVAAPYLMVVFAPGFAEGSERYNLAVDLIRIMFPYLFFISLAGFIGSILNSYDKFAIPAFTPVFLNIILIAAAVGFSSEGMPPAVALGWGVLIAGFVQLGFQLPFVAQIGLAPKPKIEFKDPAVKKVLGLMAPALFGASVSQLNILINTMIASLLPVGSVSWMSYSDRLVELPLGIFAVAIATVILPVMSRQMKAQPEAATATLDWGMRSVLIIAIPACLALVVLAKPILIALFCYGAYDERDALMSSYSLMTYAAGLPAFMLVKVLVSGFASRMDTKTPVKIGLFVLAANMALNAVVVWPLHHFWQIGHAGLTLATALAAMLNALWLYTALRRRHLFTPTVGWGRFIVQLVVSALAMVLALMALLNISPAFIELVFWQRLAWLALMCAAGLAVYFLALFVCGIRLKDFKGHF
ncbi:MAG TPA: murein biosynthesis integral membrane protein MurJ [Cellvibrionaceae bacterium]|nr:murein biosynthesis integral membrane protein MurJ [Cellvibrionaceae bacterium]